MKKPLLLVLFLAGVVVGCSKPEDQFKAHVETLRRNITNELASPLAYDIRKTDSILSPLIGQIEYTEITEMGDWGWIGRSYRLAVAYQDKTWVLTKAQSRLEPDLGVAREWFDSPHIREFNKMLGLSPR